MKRVMSIIASISMMIGMSPFCIGTPIYGDTQTNAASVTTAAGITTEYKTLDEAATAAEDGSTVAVLSDTVEMTDNITFTKQNIVFNVNGKRINTNGNTFYLDTGSLTVTGNGTFVNSVPYSKADGYLQIFYSKAGTNLTIENGYFESVDIQLVYTFGTALIKNGTFKATCTDDGFCIAVADGTDATLTIEAGTFTATAGTDFAGMNGVLADNGATLILGKQSDGTGPSITADYSVIGGNGSKSPAYVTVYGGTYTVDADKTRNPAADKDKFDTVVYVPYKGELNIYGGTFDSSSGNTSHCVSIPYSDTGSTAVNIYGGNFKAAGTAINVPASTTASDDRTISLSGGNYSSSVDSQYIAAGYFLNSDTGSTVYPYQIDSVALTGISIKTAPSKISYYEGSKFNPDGMVVTASYNDGTSKDVTGYVYSEEPLTAADTKAVISYTENGIEAAAEQAITVIPLTVEDGGTHTLQTSNTLEITCQGKLADLTEIDVDGKKIDDSSYELRSGSTILTLKSSYLNSLSTGEHSLKFVYGDTSSSTSFFVKASVSAPILTAGAGRINGTTDQMELTNDPETGQKTDCTTASTSVSSGTWYVRYKETDTKLASDWTEVTVYVDVTVDPGAHAYVSSENGTQTGIDGAFSAIIVKAEDGYYYPKDYQMSDLPEGITVTRIDASTISVSGSAENMTAIVLKDPTEEEYQMVDTCVK
jgi:hypothetical protein